MSCRVGIELDSAFYSASARCVAVRGNLVGLAPTRGFSSAQCIFDLGGRGCVILFAKNARGFFLGLVALVLLLESWRGLRRKVVRTLF